MKKAVYFVLIFFIASLLIVFFFLTKNSRRDTDISASIPNIGAIQILNGCGIKGAATAMRDHLREKGFDVKKIDDARDWNYHQTLIVSRTTDMTTAKKEALALHTDNVLLLRN